MIAVEEIIMIAIALFDLDCGLKLLYIVNWRDILKIKLNQILQTYQNYETRILILVIYPHHIFRYIWNNNRERHK